jgi:hypothetical protein
VILTGAEGPQAFYMFSAVHSLLKHQKVHHRYRTVLLLLLIVTECRADLILQLIGQSSEKTQF